MLTRRGFLTSSGLALFAVGSLPRFLGRTALAAAPRRNDRRILVAVFLRGAADGLNIVVPYGDHDYYAARPTIAVPRPAPASARDDGRAIDLDGFFGLHPRLAPLKALYDAGELAIVEAVGSPDHTRSHFDAQDFMESGTPGRKDTPDGWLNRALQHAPREGASPFRAVALGRRMPRSLQGAAPALVLDDLRSFALAQHREGNQPRPGAEAFAATVEKMYETSGDPLLSRNAGEMFRAIRMIDAAGPARTDPPRGYPEGPFGKALADTAAIIKAGLGLEVAFVETGGWDHHVNEGGVEGQLAWNLDQFGRALTAFRHGLGERFEDVVVVTMSEFGRTVHENGNRGTDHGHANVMLVAGGRVRGGRVYGTWPGLGAGGLFEGRDLALTTDFREVFAELAVEHLGIEDTRAIFPGFEPSTRRFRGLVA